jgi:hypothetical protein
LGVVDLFHAAISRSQLFYPFFRPQPGNALHPGQSVHVTLPFLATQT